MTKIFHDGVLKRKLLCHPHSNRVAQYVL